MNFGEYVVLQSVRLKISTISLKYLQFILLLLKMSEKVAD